MHKRKKCLFERSSLALVLVFSGVGATVAVAAGVTGGGGEAVEK